MNGTVVACTRDAKAAWPLLRQTVPVAQRLGCPVVLMLDLENEENQSSALEYAYQCARRFGAELTAFSGPRAMNRMFAEAQRRNVFCITTRDDPELLARVRLAFGFAQALDVSACTVGEVAAV